MKHKLMTVIAAATILGLAACSSGGSSKSGDSLVLYASHPIEFIDYFTEAFEADNPGVKVELITGGTGDLLSRVQGEANNPQGDVMWGGSAATGASSPELFSEFDSPVLSEIVPELLDPEGFNAPFAAFTMMIIYNKDLVDEADLPETWQDLADPKWKDKVIVADPASASSSYAAMTAWHEIGGWELVEGIASNAILAESSSDAPEAVGNGEVPIGITFEEPAVRWQESGRVGMIYPSDGLLLGPEGMFIIKDGPNPDNAKKFVEFILATEQQQTLADKFPGRRPANVNVQLPDELPAASDLRLIPFPEDSQSNRDEWLAKWDEIKINLG